MPAKELENLIVRRLAFLGHNKKIVEKIVKDAQESSVKAFGPLREDRRRIQEEIRKTDEEAKKLVGALGAQNNGVSRNRFITDRLDELQETKQKAEERLAEIELSIRGLEGRMIDAEVIQRNLQRFEAVFEKLTPNEKKDLLRLLIKEIIYNQDPSKIKMTLRPLPELDLEIEGGKASFDERQDWLPKKAAVILRPPAKKNGRVKRAACPPPAEESLILHRSALQDDAKKNCSKWDRP